MRALDYQTTAGGGRTWWTHLQFTRINIGLIILRKKIDEWRVVGAARSACVLPSECCWRVPGLATECRREVSAATESGSSSDVLNGDRRLKKKQLTRLVHAPSEHVGVRGDTHHLPERTFEVACAPLLHAQCIA